MMNRTHVLTCAGLFFLSACGAPDEGEPDEEVSEVAQANHGCPNYSQSGNHLTGTCAADFQPLDCAAWCAAQDPSCTVSPGNGTVNACEDQAYPGGPGDEYGFTTECFCMPRSFLPQAPPPACPTFTHRVDAFIFSDMKTCLTGNACSGGSCLKVYNDAGAVVLSFAADSSFRAVRPSDPAVLQAPLVKCLDLPLDAAQIAEVQQSLLTSAAHIKAFSHGTIRLQVVPHVLGSTPSNLSLLGNGLWVSPWDVTTATAPFLSSHTGFTFATAGVRDPNQHLHFDIAACGLAYGANYGLGGAGYSWIPKTAGSFWFECAQQDVYTHEWLHQAGWALNNLSGFQDIYHDSYPACGQAASDPLLWFPSPDDGWDPDASYCGGFATGNEQVSQHILGAHWPASGRSLIANHCRNHVRDYGETGIDTGNGCPADSTLPEAPQSCP